SGAVRVRGRDHLASRYRRVESAFAKRTIEPQVSRALRPGRTRDGSPTRAERTRARRRGRTAGWLGRDGLEAVGPIPGQRNCTTLQSRCRRNLGQTRSLLVDLVRTTGSLAERTYKSLRGTANKAIPL